MGLLRISALTLIKGIILIVPVLISVAFITLAERKILRLIGLRQGPNKVSVQGILQPIADALKLRNKRCNQLSNYSLFLYYFTVIVIIFCSLLLWTSLSSSERFINWKFSILVIIIVLGVSSIKAIMAGWRTYGKYPLIGRIRTVSQIISYESILYLCLLATIWIVKSFNLEELNKQDLKILRAAIPLILIFWLPSMIAELNRTPYDFSEGERELVRGFNTEFGSRAFTIIFLREYRNIIFFMSLTTTMFFSSNRLAIFLRVLLFFNFWMIWIRRTLPRIRFDKFITKAWKFYIPIATLIIILLMIEI